MLQVETIRQVAPPTRLRCSPSPLVGRIVRRVAEHYGVPVDVLCGPRRTGKLPRQRQVAMTVAHRVSGRPLVQIAMGVGCRDHTTVMHAIRVVTALEGADPAFAAEVAGLERMVRETAR